MGKESSFWMLGATWTIFLLILPLVYLTVFRLEKNPFDFWKHHLSTRGHKNRLVEEQLKFLLKGEDQMQLETTGISCHSELHFEICLANKPVRVNSHKIYIPSNQNQTISKEGYIIKPYARKDDVTAMKYVTPLHILHNNYRSPVCQCIHRVPAVIFSSGGFTGNIFHEFNDIIIPLFITSRHFNRRIQFVITDFKPWWFRKYHRILTHLSQYEVINLTGSKIVHCFPAAVIGLRYHDNLALNATEVPKGISIKDFQQFLRESYRLKIKKVMKMENPRLLLISRRKTRMILNEASMVKMMEELGFQVTIATPQRMSNLDEFANIVNSCSVMVGAHGAGLTNELFLPNGAIMIQVVPLGLDWPSSTYFGGPGSEMGVQYLEYKIQPEESNLFELYGREHPVIKDPMSIFMQGYRAARAVYVDGQNVTINLVRFREILVEALELLGHPIPSS